jgi:hypothetical protein
MQDSYRELMNAFLECIVTDEEFAREIAEIADRCEHSGAYNVAAAMRNVSRNHRIRGIEGRTQIAALVAQVAGEAE